MDIRKIIIGLISFIQIQLNGSAFDTLNLVEKSKRVEVAYTIFMTEVSTQDSSKVFNELNKLSQLSRKLQDQELEISVTQFKAYYYVNKIPELLESGFKLYENAIQEASEKKFKVLEARIMNELGFLKFLNKEFPKGFEYLLRSDRLMQTIGYENIPNVSVNLYCIGFAYMEFNNIDKAIYYYNKAISYAKPNSFRKSQLLNQVGLLYLAKKMFDEAESSFSSALKIAKLQNDTARIGLLSGNIGSVFLKKGLIDSSKVLLSIDYEYSLKYSNWRSAVGAQLLLIEIDLIEQNLTSASGRIVDIEHKLELMKNIKGNKQNEYLDDKLWLDYYKQKANLYFSSNEFKLAYRYLDTCFKINDSIVAQNAANMVVNLETQIMTEKYLNEMELLEKEKSLQKVIRNSIIALLILIIIFSIRTIINLKHRRKKEKKILMLEKSKAEAELQISQKELNIFMSGLKEKNLLIEQFKREIDHLKSGSNPEIPKGRDKTIEKLTNATILTEEEWKKFRRIFDDVHKGFFQRLAIKYPDLTYSEVRLLALIKLDLSNYEIASMIGISPDSVSKSSFRLRRKLNIKAHSDLFEFVESI
jgi:tetratricopeptide (TPR) repeat protein